MALRLAGEELCGVQGLDALGWLREIDVDDSSPGLKVINPSGDPIQVFSASNKYFKFLVSPGAGNPEAYFLSYYGGIRFGSYAGESVHGKLYIANNRVQLVSENNKPIQIDAGSAYVDIRNTIKNTGSGNSGRVMVDDDLDLNWNELFQVKGVPIQTVKQVNFDSSSPATIVNLPAYTEVVDVKVQIVTQFDGTDPSLDIGDASDVDGLMPAASINAGAQGWYGDNADDKGVYLWDAANGHPIKKTYTAQTDIICTIGGTGMSQGIANVYVSYRRLA